MRPDIAKDAVMALRIAVDEQAEDGGLWFQAETAPEAYLQQALRRLHALIEEFSDVVFSNGGDA